MKIIFPPIRWFMFIALKIKVKQYCLKDNMKLPNILSGVYWIFRYIVSQT